MFGYQLVTEASLGRVLGKYFEIGFIIISAERSCEAEQGRECSEDEEYEQEKLNKQNQFPRNIELQCQKIYRFYWFFLEKKQEQFLYEKVYLIRYEDFIFKPLDMLNLIKKKFLLDIVYNNNLDIWRKSSNTYKNFCHPDALAKFEG